MRIGVHLPVMATGGSPLTAAELADYAQRAEQLGFAGLAASDHLVHRAPWLDAVASLTIAAAVTRRLALVTAVLLPGLRTPAVTAKTLGTLDALSGGRVIAGVGAGASAADYAACGIPFGERWQRLDASILALRALWAAPGEGEARMAPAPAQAGSLPIWVGSWGAPAGLRRAARLGDGWIASAFNTTPTKFAADWATVRDLLAARSKDPPTFSNALASLFFHVSDDRPEAEAVIRDVLAPTLGRAPAELLPRVLAGPAADCAVRLSEYAAAGVQWVFLWPIVEPARQIERLTAEVLPLCDQ